MEIHINITHHCEKQGSRQVASSQSKNQMILRQKMEAVNKSLTSTKTYCDIKTNRSIKASLEKEITNNSGKQL